MNLLQIAALLLQAPTVLIQTPPVTVPPPPARAMPYPAPVFVPHEGQADSVLPVHVEVSGEGRVLWSGTLRIGGSMPANVTYNVQQAGERAEACGAIGRFGSSRDSFNIGLSRFRSNNNPGTVTVNASWTRSVRPAPCGSFEAPSRTVSFTDTAELVPGRPVQLRGDGGLVVSVRLADR